MASILAALLALLRAVPVIADLIKFGCDAWAARQKAANEADVSKRKSDKDAFVDAGVDRWVRADTSPARQQQAPDGSSGLPAGGAGGSGVVPGRAENNQRAGI